MLLDYYTFRHVNKNYFILCCVDIIMKPLLRWVIGPMSDPGIDLFRLSINKIIFIFNKNCF